MSRRRYRSKDGLGCVEILFIFFCISIAIQGASSLLSPEVLEPTPTFQLRPTKTATAKWDLSRFLPSPVVLTGCVKEYSLNIREGPSTEYAVIGRLTSGSCISITGRNIDSSWVYISTAVEAGWVSAFYLDIPGNLDHVAVIDTSDFQRLSTVQPNYGGASAICNDGTLSYSEHRKGTCSHHGGVKEWLRNLPP